MAEYHGGGAPRTTESDEWLAGYRERLAANPDAAPAAGKLAAISPERRAELEASHWSLRMLGAELGVSAATLSRAGWHARMPHPTKFEPAEGFAAPRDNQQKAATPEERLDRIMVLWAKYMKRRPNDVATVRRFVAWLPPGTMSVPSVYSTLRMNNLLFSDLMRIMNDTRPTNNRHIARRSDALTPEDAQATLDRFVAAQRALGEPTGQPQYDAWRIAQDPVPSSVFPIRWALGNRSWRDLISATIAAADG